MNARRGGGVVSDLHKKTYSPYALGKYNLRYNIGLILEKGRKASSNRAIGSTLYPLRRESFGQLVISSGKEKTKNPSRWYEVMRPTAM